MTTCRVLVVEDKADDAELVVLTLCRHGIDPTWERVASSDDLRAALRRSSWDVVLSDYDLPGFGGEAALEIVRAHAPDLPFIVVSGIVGEEAAVAMMRAGAADYVLKHSLLRLGPAVEREVRDAAGRRARREAEAALRLRDRAIREVPNGIVICDPNLPDNPLIYVSPSFERLTGYTTEEAIGRNCRFLQGPDTDPAVVATVRAAVSAAEMCAVEVLNYRKDGSPFWNQLTVSPMLNEDGRPTHFVGLLTDVTERRQLEERLRQAQKMEAFGQLAGGVAHDFNNMLQVINGYAVLMLRSLPADNPLVESVQEIVSAGERSAVLTRQLLAFARQQVVAPKAIAPSAAAADTVTLLQRLIGDDVQLVTDLRPEVWPVFVDAGQMEQVLLNLVLNARDAMPDGGTVTVRTRNEPVGGDSVARHPDAQPGPHAVLSVTDTGTGMTPEIQARIFEPFFTTKGIGKGTGLGLATVFNIVQRAGGHVRVRSRVGTGSTFEVYLPAAEGAVEEEAEAGGMSPRGAETVLVVEDERAVRVLVRSVLTAHGYKILEAADGAAAVRVAEGHAGTIHLLISDVVMPGASGRLAATRILAKRPDMRVLFMSGYLDDAVVRHGVQSAEVPFLQKPFNPTVLTLTVRQVLDAPQRQRVDVS